MALKQSSGVNMAILLKWEVGFHPGPTWCQSVDQTLLSMLNVNDPLLKIISTSCGITKSFSSQLWKTQFVVVLKGMVIHQVF